MAFSTVSPVIDRPDPVPEPVRLRVPLHVPLWTYILLGINALVWLAMTLAGGSENTLILVIFGAKYQPLIAAGEYWRLLTANFLHIGIVHLLMNSYALYLFGLQVERRFGRLKFVVMYLLSGLGGTVLSYVGSSALSAGASGAIFGLVGAITVYYATYRDAFGAQGKQQLSSLLLVTGYNILWGFINPRIDNLGHLGGLAIGLVLGWAFCPRYVLSMDPGGGPELKDRAPRGRALALAGAVAVLLAVLSGLGTWLHTRAGIL
ncbi:MAG: rhomboid family intramembrane serine protease [Chloroflexi bacterium]|nr:rhomboid family intramembrane serine protease [Chloroflexota bacterium]